MSGMLQDRALAYEQASDTVKQLREEKTRIDRELGRLNASIRVLDADIAPYAIHSKLLSTEDRSHYAELLAQRQALESQRNPLRVRAAYINEHFSSLLREARKQRRTLDTEPLPDVEQAIKEVIEAIDVAGGRFDEKGKRAWLTIKRMVGALGERAFAAGRVDLLSELTAAKQEIDTLRHRLAQQQSQLEIAKNHKPLSLKMLIRLWRERVREVDPLKSQRGYLHRFQIDADLEAEIREVIGE